MIRLISPNIKSEELIFYWQQNAKVASEENKYIINTIYWAMRDIDELKNDSEFKALFEKVDIKSFSSVKELTDCFNRKLEVIKLEWLKSKYIPDFFNRRAEKGHLHHIIEYCYSKAVDDPDRLNQYVPFSAEVYGETSFELVDQIIDWIQLKEDDVFIDLGSGVGQVVLQVAASTDCKSCLGIEKADYPAQCSLTLDREFKRMMVFFAKPFNQYKLMKGDFLGDDFQDTISSSSVIFANNFAFGPLVDHQLKNRFTSLREGAKIISSKAFCPLKFRITDRNLDDIGSIMRVTSLNAMENAVSWTCSAFSYFLHQVDHSMLEEYFAKYKLKTKEPQVNGVEAINEMKPVGEALSNDGVESQRILRKRVRGGDDGEERPSGVHHHSHHNHEGTDHLSTTATLGLKTTYHHHHHSSTRHHRHYTHHHRPPTTTVLHRTHYDHDTHRHRRLPTQQRHSHHVRRHRHKQQQHNSLSSASSRRSGQSSITLQQTSTDKRPNRTTKRPSGTTAARHQLLDLHKHTLSRLTVAEQSPRSINQTSGRMSDFAATYQPHDVNIHVTTEDSSDFYLGHSNQVVPLAVRQFLDLTEQRLMLALHDMQKPSYRAELLVQIEHERRKQTHLSQSCRELEQVHLPKLHSRGSLLLQQHLDLLGLSLPRLQESCAPDFFCAARQMIRHQSTLQDQLATLKCEISQLLLDQKQLKTSLIQLDLPLH